MSSHPYLPECGVEAIRNMADGNLACLLLLHAQAGMGQPLHKETRVPQENKEQVLAEVRKLLSAADSPQGVSEAERDNAVRLVQDLLFRYSLSMSCAPERQEGAGYALGSSRVYVEGYQWKGKLLYYIAPAFLCKVYRESQGRNKSYWIIVGRETYREVLIDLWNYVVQQVEEAGSVEFEKRDKRRQYARLAVVNYLERFDIEMPEIEGVENDPVEVALSDLQSTLETMKGDEQLEFIAMLTGLTKSYASEVRPFLNRGEIAPEWVENMGVWKRSFYSAALSRIVSRVNDFYKETVKDTGKKGLALVRSERRAIKQWIEQEGQH